MDKLQILEDIVANGYRKVREVVDGKSRKLVIDGFSASAMLQVAKALSDENRHKYLSWPWIKMADFAFKHTGIKK